MMAADIDISTWSTAILALGSIVGSVAAVVRFFSHNITKHISTQLDLKLDPMADELATIRDEVTYNGGGSLKDAVRRTERRIDRLEGRFDEHDKFTRGEKEGN